MASAGLAAAVLAVALLAAAASAAVTYDRKAVVVNGQRRILLSGSIHYPRSVPEVRRTPLLFPFPGPSGTPVPAVPSPPEMRARWGSAAAVRGASLTPLACVLASSALQMWPDLIQKAKDGGLDVVQTYVFWNGHEPSPGQVVSYHCRNTNCW